VKAGRCLPRRQRLFIAGLLVDDQVPGDDDASYLRDEIEAVRRGERTWGHGR
jgi:hypothetical protein